MTYYAVQTWSRFGELHLELNRYEGDSIPQNNQQGSNEVWHLNEFFPTLELALDYFKRARADHEKVGRYPIIGGNAV